MWIRRSSPGMWLLLISFLVCFWGELTSAELDLEKKKTSILNELLARYDKRVRPHINGSAVLVTCSMFINSLDSVREATMEYGMTMIFTEKWKEPRMMYNESIFDGTVGFIGDRSIVNDIWVPDLYFTNVKEGNFHDVTVENKYIHITPDGEITLSMKLTLILSCYMDFRRFPMDQQECGLDIESYTYSSENLLLQWRESKPVITKQGVRLPLFGISPISTLNCTHDMYETGNVSCIGMTFVLTRGLGFYLLQTYLPSILIVVLSWMSFWIDITSTPARVTLCTTTVLTMTTTSVGNFDGLPKVAYIKAIDIWFAATLSFIVGISFEYAIVNYLWSKDLPENRNKLSTFKDIKISKICCHCVDSERKPKSSPSRSRNQGTAFDSFRERRNSDSSKSRMYDLTHHVDHDGDNYSRGIRGVEVKVQPEQEVAQEEPYCRRLARDIDRTARWGFPVTFVLFVIAYFAYYLPDSNVWFE
ncbi:glycine receptor subunit alpha-4-like [Ptychodera flava]|uniref:glycine receptor subunit alpha-4-like n=1 Tax=Ptychodera flava TaxID=63121 RepID=UPI00396A2F2B